MAAAPCSMEPGKVAGRVGLPQNIALNLSILRALQVLLAEM